MNRSDVGNTDSGVLKSKRFDSDFIFSSSSFPRSEKAALGSSSGLSKPRFQKTRKQLGSQNPRSIPVRDGSQNASGFNPFRLNSGNLSAVSSRAELGAAVSGAHGKSESDAFVFGAARSDSNVESAIGKELLDELRKLRINNESHSNAKDGSYNLNAGLGESSRLSGSSNRADVTDGNETSSGLDGSMVSDLPDEIRKLNIKGHGDGAKGENLRFNLNDTTHFRSSSKCRDDTCVGKSLESELPNEFKNLQIKGRNEHGHGITNSSFDTKVEFVFEGTQKGEQSVAENLSASLSNQMKTLNIKRSVSSGDARKGMSDTSGKTENILSGKMNKLNIVGNVGGPAGQGAMGASSSQVLKETDPLNSGKNSNQIGKSVSAEFALNAKTLSKEGISCQNREGQPANTTERSGGSITGEGNFHTVLNVSGPSSLDRPDHQHGFSFSTKQDNLKSPGTGFRTPNVKESFPSHFAGFSAKREASKDSSSQLKREKLRQVNPFHLQPETNFIPKECKLPPKFESSESYSPMEVSPYQETLADEQTSEASITSDNPFCFDTKEASTDSSLVEEAIDEDMLASKKRIGIDDDCEMKCSEMKGTDLLRKDVGTKSGRRESLSTAESESYKTANDHLDTDSGGSSTSAESEFTSTSRKETRDCDGRKFPYASSSEDYSSCNFTFSSSSSTQGQSTSSANRQYRKKSRTKVGYVSHRSTSYTNDASLSSPVQFYPLSGASSLLSPCKGLNIDVSTSQCSGENKTTGNFRQKIERKSVSVSLAAQEACEKWRLRGNQAYANGDLSKSEECYSQGIGCVSSDEESKSCLRALMLCYSNRAATRMSLGRMREALGDCMAAAALDPDFLRVQVRAANCCLALGEVEDATLYFKKCLQSKSDICVDRKIAVEASDGLLKTQKVSSCMTRAAELLEHRIYGNAETALDLIADVLSVSLYSEKLLQMKAEALLMLQKYEEVIQLCKQTLSFAEKNSPLRGADCDSGDLEDSGSAKSSSCRLWRLCVSFRAYFCLGRLEDALEIVEKQEGSGIRVKGLESALPLYGTVCELLRLKASGNEAFQSGRLSEAIDHYTSALTCNTESRPFAAICFCNRAAAYKALGQITDAIADCSLSIALDGNYVKPISRRATLFEMIRDYDQAATDLRKVLSLLSKQAEEKPDRSRTSGKPAAATHELQQVQLHLSTVEEEAKKGIPFDLYLIMGIEPTVTPADIRKAYRKAALRHHPDKAVQYLSRGENRDDLAWKEIVEEVHKDADRLFKMIGEAYAVLSDPTKRSRYDLEVETRNSKNTVSRSSTSRTQEDVQNYTSEHNTRRHWREIRKSYWNSQSRGAKASWSSRYQ